MERLKGYGAGGNARVMKDFFGGNFPAVYVFSGKVPFCMYDGGEMKISSLILRGLFGILRFHLFIVRAIFNGR